MPLSPHPFVEKQPGHSLLLVPCHSDLYHWRLGEEPPAHSRGKQRGRSKLLAAGQAPATEKEGGVGVKLGVSAPNPHSPSPHTHSVKGLLLGSSADVTTGDPAVQPGEALPLSGPCLPISTMRALELKRRGHCLGWRNQGRRRG